MSVNGGGGLPLRRARMGAVGSRLARATGLAENAIRKGLRELDCPEQLPAGRVRKAGAGPKRLVDTDETLLKDLRQRTKLWKTELQKLANHTGLQISVSHFPPGTSKWNKIAHRLRSLIGKNWRGRPLVSHEVIINSINASTSDTGLEVYAQFDTRDYPNAVEVTDAELATVNLVGDKFHPEWNYTIKPSTN